MASRPRIQFLVDRPRWAQARTARAVSRYLADEFECRVVFESHAPNLSAWDCDLLYVSSWDSTWHRQFDFEPAKIVKAVTDHRWQAHRWQAMSPADFVSTWLGDVGHVTCTSERLRSTLEPFRAVEWTPVGFDPFVFPGHAPWRGPLRFGWAGNRADESKGVDRILLPAAGDEFELAIAGGDLQLAAMGEFFRSVDVFALASEHEGTPLTLVEAMASGCFPVCVDVGVVPEFVEHGVNGLIVERDPDAFREAFRWCADNADAVRRAGVGNAEWMRHRRTWEHVAEHWREAFRVALTGEDTRGEIGEETPAVPRIALLASRNEPRIVSVLRRLLPQSEIAEIAPMSSAQHRRLRGCDVALVYGSTVGEAARTGVLDSITAPVVSVAGFDGEASIERRLRDALAKVGLVASQPNAELLLL